MSNHQVLILCGGKGTRLSTVWNQPKILAPIGKRNYLQVIMDILKETGFCFEFTLATGYKSKEIESDFICNQKNIFIQREDQELGTGGALLSFMKNNQYKRFTVMNGDTLFNSSDLKAYFQKILHCSDNVIAVKEVKSNERYGSVETFKKLEIRKPRLKKNNDLVYAGLATFETRNIRDVIKRPISFEDVINKSEIPVSLVSKHILKNGFHDIGTPESLRKAEKWLKS